MAQDYAPAAAARLSRRPAGTGQDELRRRSPGESAPRASAPSAPSRRRTLLLLHRLLVVVKDVSRKKFV